MQTVRGGGGAEDKFGVGGGADDTRAGAREVALGEEALRVREMGNPVASRESAPGGVGIASLGRRGEE